MIGLESTETILLPKFLYLCEDSIWGVRKACADVFMPVSCVCSPSVRKSKLSPIFINLLKDQSRWVRMTAYQALGPFISTFADPTITDLLYNDNGDIIIRDRELLKQCLEDLEKSNVNNPGEKIAEEETAAMEEESLVKVESNEKNCDTNSIENHVVEEMDIVEDDDNHEATEVLVHTMSMYDLSLEEDRANTYNLSKKVTEAEVDMNLASFNSFLYWREPLPVLDDLDDLQMSKAVAKEPFKINNNPIELFGSSESCNTGNGGPGLHPTSVISGVVKNNNKHQDQQQMKDPALPQGPPATLQNIVPQLLVDHFISMTDPSR